MKNKIVLYTQRVEVAAGYNERRDCVDQQIPRFLRSCGFLPVAAGNLPEYIENFAESFSLAGILLTGGNDLARYGGNAPERDETERLLLEHAVRHDIPLLGFCRGMQMIADYFENPLQPIEGHVACRHHVEGKGFSRPVNSYHRWGLTTVREPLQVLARAEDGVIEAICHRRRRIMGIMWHPERETPFMKDDIEMFSRFFAG